MSLVELSLKNFLPFQVSWWQLTWGYRGIFVIKIFAVILGLSWLLPRVTLKVNTVLTLSRYQVINHQRPSCKNEEMVVIRWKPLDMSGAEFQGPNFPLKLWIPDRKPCLILSALLWALARQLLLEFGAWEVRVWISKCFVNVTGSLRSRRKNPNFAAAEQNHEALILWTLNLRHGSGGCFSPL